MDISAGESGSRAAPLTQILFNYKGRVDRRTYWKIIIPLSLASNILAYSVISLSFVIISNNGAISTALYFFLLLSLLVSLLLIMWMSFALLVKRFHDRGRTGWFSLVGLIPILGQLWLLYDTILMHGNSEANRYGMPHSGRRETSRLDIALLVGGLILTFILPVAGRGFLAEGFLNPSGSNQPTILPGDVIFVSKFTYRFHSPRLGDLVVFVNPRTGEDYMKRLVGLPGDTVQIRRGTLIINGVSSKRERIADYIERNWDRFYGRILIDHRYRYVETTPNGTTHEILGDTTNSREDSSPQDNTGVFTVPEGHFFVVGDNRDNSNDSRLELGYVPVQNLVGRVEYCYFSREDNGAGWKVWTWPSSIRWDRFFKVLH